MGNDRGLPAVPRGLSRELTFFLQSLLGVVGRLSGLTRGSDDVRAVRVSDASGFSRGSSSTVEISAEGISSKHLASGSVTTSKLANEAVTADKLGNASVSTDKLADGAVTAGKLASGIMLMIVSGDAEDGEVVTLPGVWQGQPLVSVASVTPPDGWTMQSPLGVLDLQESTTAAGEWGFTAAGSFAWVAVGYPAE